MFQSKCNYIILITLIINFYIDKKVIVIDYKLYNYFKELHENYEILYNFIIMMK